jgi:hypothetical protein
MIFTYRFNTYKEVEDKLFHEQIEFRKSKNVTLFLF